jgi:iron complex transport system substrate-binding protein
MKIVSLLPSATEIVCALGLGDCLVGVTHECDYPPEVTGKPVLTASRIHSQALTSVEIDHAVSTRLGGHQSLYTLDEERLAALRPDLVLTQELCAVCAVSYADVQTAARVLNVGTRVVSLEPTTFEEVFGTIELVGRLTDRVTAATELVASLRARVAAVRALSPRASGDHGCGCVSGWSRPTRLATGCPPRWKPRGVERCSNVWEFRRRG